MAQEDHKETQQAFAIQRVYIKDVSFESPLCPFIFREKWEPQVNLEVSNKAEKLKDDVFNVILSLTATVKKESTVVFLAEVHQGGIFSISGFDPSQHEHMVGSFCPNILYPYAREVITDLSVRGGFPPLYLAPVNFDNVFAEHKKRNQQQAPLQQDNEEKTTH